MAARAVNPMAQCGRSAALPASVLDLGIGPQVNASWALQLLQMMEAISGRSSFGIKEMMRSGYEARGPPQPALLALLSLFCGARRGLACSRRSCCAAGAGRAVAAELCGAV